MPSAPRTLVVVVYLCMWWASEGVAMTKVEINAKSEMKAVEINDKSEVQAVKAAADKETDINAATMAVTLSAEGELQEVVQHAETKSSEKHRQSNTGKQMASVGQDSKKDDDLTSPFTGSDHGCNDLINHCSPHAGDRTAWYDGNLQAWKAGFGVCCAQSGVTPDTLCDDLEVALFDFMKPSVDAVYEGSQVVKELPQSDLSLFCVECKDLVATHFVHEQEDSHLQGGGGGLVSGVVNQVSRFSFYLHAGTPESRAAAAKRRLDKCFADPECNANTASIKEVLLRSAEVLHGHRGKPKNLFRMREQVLSGLPDCTGDQYSFKWDFALEICTGDQYSFCTCNELHAGNPNHAHCATIEYVGTGSPLGEDPKNVGKNASQVCPQCLQCVGNNTADLPYCVGDSATFNSGPAGGQHQPCECYAHSGYVRPSGALSSPPRYIHCDTDTDVQAGDNNMKTAAEVCHQCKKCQLEPTSGDCFPGSAMVATVDRGEIAVSSLQSGDRLFSPQVKASPSVTKAEFMTDSHLQEPDHAVVQREYIAISHELMKADRPLLISEKHGLFVSHRSTGPWSLKPAGDVKVGDFVLATPLGEQRDMATSDTQYGDLTASSVTKIANVIARGKYSPLTTTHRLLVEGVAVSSFAYTTQAQREFARHASVETIEFFVSLAIFPNKIWYWAGLPFSQLYVPSQIKMWERFFDFVLAPVNYAYAVW